MDLHMPELDGLMATMKIRAGEAGEAARNIWIIALTADAREDQRERTLAAGVNDYLTKPVRVPELTAALDRFIRERKS
jgi:CheY-like chemotaxis protein